MYRIWRSMGLIGVLDTLSHRIWLPKRLQDQICDRYDARALGVTLAELHDMDENPL